MSSSDSPLNENSMDALDQIIITGLALIGGILRWWKGRSATKEKGPLNWSTLTLFCTLLICQYLRNLLIWFIVTPSISGIIFIDYKEFEACNWLVSSNRLIWLWWGLHSESNMNDIISWRYLIIPFNTFNVNDNNKRAADIRYNGTHKDWKD